MEKRTVGLIKGLIVVVVALGVSACASGPIVQYGDATAVQTVSTDFSSTDLQQITAAMVDSLLSFPSVVQLTSARAPVLLVDVVKNKTMQHIDTESVTDSIRTRLIKSGKFKFVDRTTDAALIDELEFQRASGLVDQAAAVQKGKQLGAEYLLTSNLSEIEQSNNKVRDVYYKVTMNLKNLTTGILEWSEEKEIRKTSTRRKFGG